MKYWNYFCALLYLLISIAALSQGVMPAVLTPFLLFFGYIHIAIANSWITPGTSKIYQVISVLIVVSTSFALSMSSDCFVHPNDLSEGAQYGCIFIGILFLPTFLFSTINFCLGAVLTMRMFKKPKPPNI